jgi:hypothetical protein
MWTRRARTGAWAAMTVKNVLDRPVWIESRLLNCLRHTNYRGNIERRL